MIIEPNANPELPVLVIGAAGTDMVGRLNSTLRQYTSNPAQIRFTFGGAARNVAENLLHLGMPVRLITVVGSDDAGNQLIGEMRETGADVGGILQSSQYPTGSYLAVVNPDGKLEFGLDDMRIMAELSPDHIHTHEDLFSQSSLVFIDANLSKPTLRTIMTIARRVKVPVCADPTSEVLASRLLPHLKNLRLVVPNCGEAAVLSARAGISNQAEAIEAAKYMVSQGVDIAIITMAEAGVCYATSETSGQVPPVRTQIVDPTGAGDALTAAVLFGLLNEMPVDDAVRLGVAAASLTLTYRGAVVPDLSLEKIYDQLR